MFTRWNKKLDILGPIVQSRRCLDLWLREEKRFLPERQRQRAAALIARYFLHEDGVSDQLMLSFLRHYSGHHEVDMEDPLSVRMEIKSVLDRSTQFHAAAEGRKRALMFMTGLVIMLAVIEAWTVTHHKIGRTQQAELKALVHQIDALDSTVTAAKVWAVTKQPLRVRSYQDMTWWDYRQSRKILKNRLQQLKS